MEHTSFFLQLCKERTLTVKHIEIMPGFITASVQRSSKLDCAHITPIKIHVMTHQSQKVLIDKNNKS